MRNKYSRIFAILKDINSTGAAITKEDIVSDFTEGKSNSLSSLNDFQLGELTRKLMALQTQFKAAIPDHLDKTRKGIISQFRSLGKSADDAKAWAEKYGVFGVKRKFNDYTGQELWQLLQNAKKMKRDSMKAVLKKIQ